MKKAKKTAVIVNQIRTKKAKEMMAKIETLLDAHTERSVENPSSWGYAGDMELVNRELADIANFLSYPSQIAQ